MMRAASFTEDTPLRFAVVLFLCLNAFEHTFLLRKLLKIRLKVSSEIGAAHYPVCEIYSSAFRKNLGRRHRGGYCT
jgi:hypothetical protein